MARSDISAGGAFVRLYAKDGELIKSLRNAKQRLADFGNAARQAGTILAGIGGTALAGLGAAVKHFIDFGSALDDVSKRTGRTASDLAELKYAAEQSGATFEDVERAILNAQRKGLDFDQVGAQLAAMTDPAERTKLAFEAFGKSGAKLIPMFQELSSLRAEAQSLGIGPSQESVSMAAKLGDMWDSILTVGKSIVFEVGAALAPVLLPAAEVVKQIGASVIRWVKENGDLIRTVGLIAAGITGAGAAMVAIGSTISFLMTPLGMVVGAVTAIGLGIAAWMRYTESGRTAFLGMSTIFQRVREVVGSIGDALIGGDIALAGQIAAKAVQVAFASAVAAISSLFTGTIGDAIGTIGTKIVGGDFQGAWETAVTGMGALWDTFTSVVVSTFTSAAKKVMDIWNGMVKDISTKLIEISSDGTDMGKAVGEAFKNSFLHKVGQGGTQGNDATQQIASGVLGVDLKKEQERMDRAGLGGSVKDDATQAASTAIDDTTNAIKKKLDEMKAAAEAAAKASADKFKKETEGGADKAAEAVERLNAELDALRKEAAEKREAARDRIEGAAAGSDGASLKTSVSTTFSAAALSQMRATPADRAAEKIAKNTKDALERMDRTNRLLEKMSPATVIA